MAWFEHQGGHGAVRVNVPVAARTLDAAGGLSFAKDGKEEERSCGEKRHERFHGAPAVQRTPIAIFADGQRSEATNWRMA